MDGFRRRLRRYRPWWPVGLAGAGAIVFALVEAVRGTSVDRGIAGPLAVVCAILVLAGLITGVIEGIVQPSAPNELRIQLALVVLALATAAMVGGGALVVGLAALLGSGFALGAAWCGRSVMMALLGNVDDD